MSADLALSILAWGFAGALALWAVVRLFGLEVGYPFAALMAYTPYAALAAPAVAAGCAVAGRWPAASVAGAAGLILAVLLAPRAVGRADELTGTPIRVMSANLLGGAADANALLELARKWNIDVLCVQELIPSAARDLDRVGVGGQYPHQALQPATLYDGGGIYSRYPLEPADPSSGDVAATIEIAPQLRLGVVAVHPVLPGSRVLTRLWKADLRGLPPASSNGPARLLIGDFNATWDHFEFRRLVRRGYADAAERMGRGLKSTWPAYRSRNHHHLPVTLDHVLYDSDRFAVRDYRVLKLPGSDHHPIYAELVIRGASA